MTDDAKAKSPVLRDPETGRFPKGTSGNPAGRTKGTKNRITLARLMLEEQLREMLTANGPKLLRKAIKMALSGDDKVMRALLDKMMATPRGDDEANATDRDVKVIIQNLTTGPQPLPAIDGVVVRHTIKGPSHMSNPDQKPGGESQPTVTEKSSGLDYVSAMPDPAQEKSVQRRENSTKNDGK